MLHKFISQEYFQSFIMRSLYISYGKRLLSPYVNSVILFQRQSVSFKRCRYKAFPASLSDSCTNCLQLTGRIKEKKERKADQKKEG